MFYWINECSIILLHEFLRLLNPKNPKPYFSGGHMTPKEITQRRLEMYLKAEADITLHGQTVELEGMRVTRADLDVIRKMIANIRKELDRIEQDESGRRRPRIRQIVPV